MTYEKLIKGRIKGKAKRYVKRCKSKSQRVRNRAIEYFALIGDTQALESIVVDAPRGYSD